MKTNISKKALTNKDNLVYRCFLLCEAIDDMRNFFDSQSKALLQAKLHRVIMCKQLLQDSVLELTEKFKG